MKYSVLLVALLTVSVFLSPFAQAASDGSLISPSESAQMVPRIYGSSIVWEDYRNSPGGVYMAPGSGNPDIFVYNISTGMERAVCTEGHAQQNPDIWSRLVVWEDYRNGNADIYIYDLSDPQQRDNGTRLTFDAEDQVQPRIWGSYVVWIDYRNGLDGDIYAYDLSKDSDGDRTPDWKEESFGQEEAARATFPVCMNIYEQRDVAIYGDVVVWKDYRNDTGNGDRNIFGYRISDGEEFQITSERHNQFQPAIYGDTVVWVDMRDGVPTIYGKHLGSPEEFAVDPDGNSQTYPQIHGDTVVWMESVDGISVVKQAIIGKEAVQVSGKAWDCIRPDISPLGLVWADGRNHRAINGRNVTIWATAFLRNMDSNMPPVISDVNIVPDGEIQKGVCVNISVSARVYDPEGDNVSVHLEMNGQEYPMYDDGMHGDGIRGDGIYGATVNITPESSEINIRIVAQDEFGASSDFTQSMEVSGALDPVMTLIGIGAIILVLAALVGGVYIIRKKSAQMDEGPEKEDSGEKGKDESKED